MLQDDDKDSAANAQVEMCEACGKFPSGCSAWGHRLCYGERDGSRIGCVSLLSEVLPAENERAFTDSWVAERRKKVRAA